MSRRRIILIGLSGGIAAGAPFALNAALFVEQISPPVAFTQRLAALIDSTQSIVAPGVLAAPHTFVVGEGATDSAFGDRSVVIGYNVKQNPGTTAGASVDQVLIGNTITVGTIGINGAGTIVIGAGAGVAPFAAAPSVGSNVIIGRNAIATGINLVSGDPTNNVLIGDGATSTGGASTVLGALAVNIGAQGVSIGSQAGSGSLCVSIGYKAGSTGAATDVTIGSNGRSGSAGCVGIGAGVNNSTSTGSIAIGASANTNGRTGSIMLGRNTSVNADNYCQIGGDNTYFISVLSFGRGNSLGAGGNAYAFQCTSSFNANSPGNTLQVRAGAGTGSDANGSNQGLDLQVGILGASGSTPQVYTSCLAIRHSDLNVALWGGLAAPFSGGKGVLFIKNATTNPTVAAVAGGGILSVQGGELHFLSSSGVDNALTPAGGGSLPITSGAGGLVYNAGVAFTATHNFEVNSASALTIALTGVGGTTTVAATTLVVNSTSGNVMQFVTGGLNGDIQFKPNGVLIAIARANATAFTPGADGTSKLGLPTTGGNQRWAGLFLTGAASLSIDNSTTAAAAQIATLTNFPTGKSGNPTKFLNVLVDGTTVVVPCW